MREGPDHVLCTCTCSAAGTLRRCSMRVSVYATVSASVVRVSCATPPLRGGRTSARKGYRSKLSCVSQGRHRRSVLTHASKCLCTVPVESNTTADVTCRLGGHCPRSRGGNSFISFLATLEKRRHKLAPKGQCCVTGRCLFAGLLPNAAVPHPTGRKGGAVRRGAVGR